MSMINKPLVKMLTSSTLFAFFYCLVCMVVVVTALLTQNVIWINTSWILLSLFGVFITLAAYVSSIEALQSKRWPMVTAKLERSHVSTKLGTSSDSLYHPVVEYTFTYNGNQYSGNTVDFSASSGSKKWAQKIITDIESMGHGLKVYVDPNAPERNVIYPGIRLVHVLRYLIGPGMIILGILAVAGLIEF